MKVNSADNKISNNQNQLGFGLSPKLLEKHAKNLEKHAKKSFDKGIAHASFDLLHQSIQSSTRADVFKKGAKIRRQILNDGNPYKGHLSVYKVLDEFENNIFAKAS